jgi:hypothetical protein
MCDPVAAVRRTGNRKVQGSGHAQGRFVEENLPGAKVVQSDPFCLVWAHVLSCAAYCPIVSMKKSALCVL